MAANLIDTVDANFGTQQSAATLSGISTAHWYGVSNLLTYALNDRWSLGARLEWFQDHDGFNVTGCDRTTRWSATSFSGNFYEVSAGVNFKPTEHITLRPEVRYDWFNPLSTSIGSQNPYDNNTSPAPAAVRWRSSSGTIPISASRSATRRLISSQS